MGAVFNTQKSSPVGLTNGLHPMSSLKNNNGSTTSLSSKKRDLHVTFSLDTIDSSSSEEEAQALNDVSPLDSVLVRRNSGGSVNSFRSDDGPTLAKEHVVRIVPGRDNHHQALVAEELQSSDYDSDETEFMEAREELSDDEMEFALVLTTAAAWPKSGEDLIADLLAHGTQMAYRGYDMLRNAKAVEVKVGIVFLLLVYYAGRLASFIA
jgi:hypothetical protein